MTLDAGQKARLRRVLVPLGALVVVTAILVVALKPWRPSMPPPREVDWSAHAAGPSDARSVVWVGHSLINHRDAYDPNGFDLMQAVGRLAASAGVSYQFLDHTLYGSPLSLLWRGKPHTYDRDEPDMPQRIDTLRAAVSEHDTMVLTEGIPIGQSLPSEHSAFYAQQFYCEMVRARPDARVYVYETWRHLNASDPDGGFPSPSVFDWSRFLRDDRVLWEHLADVAGTGEVPAPTMLGRIAARFGEPTGCVPKGPIFLVPVGTVMRRLADVLKSERLPLADGDLTIAHLFDNPYRSWPAGWPLAAALEPEAERAALAGLGLRHPDGELDDIHPSSLGVYLSALVHYATLYRRSPVGLPSVTPLPDATNLRLQELVWEVVHTDPRTGVR